MDLKGEYSHGSYGSGFDGAEKAFGYYTDNENNGINGWHTYTLIWDANHMEWQLDGKTYLSQSITSNNAYCFQKNKFSYLTLLLPDRIQDLLTMLQLTMQHLRQQQCMLII